MQDKPSTSGSSTRGAARAKGKADTKEKVKEVESKAKAVVGKGLPPPPVNKGRGGKAAAAKVQTPANNASDTPVNQPTSSAAVIGDTGESFIDSCFLTCTWQLGELPSFFRLGKLLEYMEILLCQFSFH